MRVLRRDGKLKQNRLFNFAYRHMSKWCTALLYFVIIVLSYIKCNIFALYFRVLTKTERVIICKWLDCDKKIDNKGDNKIEQNWNITHHISFFFLTIRCFFRYK